jgi:polysaccharide export outer membrane protein
MQLRKKTVWMLAAVSVLTAMATLLNAQHSAKADSQARAVEADACITVFGEVQKAGRFDLAEPRRVLDSLIAAGGLSDKAGETVQVVHTGLKCFSSKEELLRVDSFTFDVYRIADLKLRDDTSNPFLRPGDVVIVLEGPVIYVVGSVVAPQAIHLREETTLSRAIAMTGGLTRDARKDRVRIFRRAPGVSTPIVIPINLGKIWKHKSEDPILRHLDIVEVAGKSKYTVNGRAGDWF